jgi:ATP-dependent DNA helicase RecQ
MRLAGVTFVDRATNVGDDVFRAVLNEAVALLNGTGLPPEEADWQRERLLAGFRWILVDEYQDIGPEQYELISALAGRTRHDEDGKLSLLAVGDDDQNIYAFNGASVEFIRRFADDYAAKPAFLVENYRSTQNIIAAANDVIGTAANRMKQLHPITVDRRRAKDKPGGRWEQLDPVAKGRVQVVPAGPDKITQAVAIVEELTRLASLDPHWSWSSAAVIAREWHFLDPVRSWCELNGVPVQTADESPPHFWRLRETQALLDWLDGRPTRIVSAGAIKGWLDEARKGVWWDVLREVAAEYDEETGGAELPLDHFKEWLAEWGREARRRQNGLLLLTAHRAKGLEFDHVAVLDGAWEKIGPEEDRDAPRRLYYVGMTRARHTLTLAALESTTAPIAELIKQPCALLRAAIPIKSRLPELERQHVRATLGDVHLGFAGRFAPGHRVHAAIAALSPGDELALAAAGEHLVLRDAAGNAVGRMARNFAPPRGMTCVRAKVAAIVVRFRSDSEAEYRRAVRSERWEVVVPEMVFGAAGDG